MTPKILISQPRPQTEKSPYFELEKKYGVEMVFRPFIKVEPMEPKDFRAQKVSIPGHTAIVFTSRHGIDHFFNLCKELRVSIPDDMKYFCKSEQVALYIQKYVQYRKRKVFFPLTGRIDDLIPIMVKHKTEKYFVPQSSAHTDDMKNKLDAAGLTHNEAVMYYTVSNDFGPDEPFDYNIVVFFSPEGVHSLKKNFPDFEQGSIAIACLGNTTIAAAKEAGLRVDMQITPELRSVPALKIDFPMRETFTKAERICSKLLIDKLFTGGNASMAAFPLRAVYMFIDAEDEKLSLKSPISVLISVPKRKLHLAVDRNRLKRQVREAYRRNKQSLYALMEEKKLHLAIAFICISDQPAETEQVTRAVKKVLRRIEESVKKEEPVVRSIKEPEIEPSETLEEDFSDGPCNPLLSED